MKNTDRQIHLIPHFMQVFPEQEAAVFSSPTCPHADPVPDTHNTRIWLPSCLISAVPLVWDTKALTRFALSGDIPIATGRPCDSPRKEIALSALVLTEVVSFQTHFRTIRLQPFWCSYVFVSVCVSVEGRLRDRLCVCVSVGGGPVIAYVCVCVCVCVCI